MIGPIRSDLETAIRDTDRQVRILQELYRDYLDSEIGCLKPEFVLYRMQELDAYENALARLQEEYQRLPVAPDLEELGVRDILASIAGAVSSGPDHPIRVQETKLRNLGEKLLEHEQQLSVQVMSGIVSSNSIARYFE